MNPKDIDNYMVEPAFEDEPEVDEDLAFEIERQRVIDETIEAGDHLLDQRKEQALTSDPIYWCHDCKRYLSEAEGEVTRCSLDAYADLSVDYDLICAHCGNSDVMTSDGDSLVNALLDIAGTNQAN